MIKNKKAYIQPPLRICCVLHLYSRIYMIPKIKNKTNLLENIKAVIDENCTDHNEIFCDIFSGTATVGDYFNGFYKIIANDNITTNVKYILVVTIDYKTIKMYNQNVIIE